ncbi:cell division inhibitor SepF [Pseudonocardia sediminis]|uniref:Cell division protein SepF n=1 Tax=Pseudonocardia sediminis TaxID=1397368 RepID=A0A4Q7UWC9_PSEST|nr:cell division protein SepF [Pseudonocardia sediminis]RZT85181.1 cell division inhibitor SepF [Pseudonocardia sediminis]
MSAMYRLKAYFGMVPADEMDFVDEPEHYASSRTGHSGHRSDRWAPAGGRFTDPDDYNEYASDSASSFDDGWSGRPAREASRPARAVRAESRLDREPTGLSGHGSGGFSGGSTPPVRGALAMDPESIHATREPVRAERPVAPVPAPSAVPEQRDRTPSAPATITTLQPRSYNEARTIGERYRDGVPVIMNLTELDDAAAKRLVDFAAGLAFALRGSIDKVTSRVFLLTPADIEVSADDARRIAERGSFRQD